MLSASKMPKNLSKSGSNWLVEINAVDENGKPVYCPDGKILKEKIQMQHGYLHNGTPQPLYFPEGHPTARLFKGMAIILEERGYEGCSR